MSPSYAKAVILLANILMVAIRAPHGRRSRTVAVAKCRNSAMEKVLLTLAACTFLLTLIWIATPALAFADYPLRSAPFFAGVVLLAVGAWLFYRSHADLGENWSISLKLREKHQLVTHGVYGLVRHPMYLAYFIYMTGQALVIPNWLAGPADGAAMLLLFAFRVGREEHMMLERFGNDYRQYMATTRRLAPRIARSTPAAFEKRSSRVS